MTSTLNRSAYPKTVDTLVPEVMEWTSELGHVPSRNQLMKRFRIGAPKANEVLAKFAGTESASAGPIASDQDNELTIVTVDETDIEVTPGVDPVVKINDDERPALEASAPAKPIHPWPVFLLALPAFVAIWGGWVGLGERTGFGPIRLLPGIADNFVINSAITLPIGVEAYAAFALWVWLSASNSERTRRFARWSAIGALALGMAGQVAFHLMEATGVVSAPWIVTTVVACLPVGVLGCGSALAHLLIADYRADKEAQR